MWLRWQAEGLNDAAIGAFKYNLGVLTSGANLMIPEVDIEPVDSLTDYASLSAEDPALLKSTVMVKPRPPSERLKSSRPWAWRNSRNK